MSELTVVPYMADLFEARVTNSEIGANDAQFKLPLDC